MEGVKNIFDRLADKLTLHSVKFDMPSLDLHSKSFQLIGLITAILVAAFLINFILSHTFLGQRYRVFVAPGVILHELAHAFFCILTGARIKKIALFEKEGGHVEHEPSKLPVVGQILISFAPFLFGALAIFFLSKYMGIRGGSVNLNEISLPSIIQSMKDTLGQLEVSRWQTWLIVYLVLSIAVTMTPSRKDFENVFLSVILVAVISFIVIRFTPLQQTLAGHASEKYTKFLLPNAMFALLESVLVLLILAPLKNQPSNSLT